MRYATFLLVQLYVALLPFEKLWAKLLGEDSVFKPYRIVGMMLMMIGVFRLFGAGAKLHFNKFDMNYAMLFIWGMTLAFFWSLVGNADLKYTWQIAPLYAFAFGVYFVVRNTNLTLPQIERLMACHVVASAVGVLMSGNQNEERLRALYKNPNSLGVAAGASMVFLFASFMFASPGRKIAKQVAVIATMAAFAMILALTGSRGAGAATAIGMGCILYMASTDKHGGAFRVNRMVIFFAGACIGVLIFGDRIYEVIATGSNKYRYSAEEVSTLGGRVDLWRSAIGVGIRHFGIGVGASQYRFHHKAGIEQLRELTVDWNLDKPLSTHSDLIALFTEYGFVGMFLYAGIVVPLLRESWRNARALSNYSFMFPFSFALLVTILIIELSGEQLYSPDYFVFIALMINIQVNARQILATNAHLTVPSGELDNDNNTPALNMPPSQQPVGPFVPAPYGGPRPFGPMGYPPPHLGAPSPMGIPRTRPT